MNYEYNAYTSLLRQIDNCQDQIALSHVGLRVLEYIKNKYPNIKDHRGAGLMQGLEFDGPVASYINAALDEGLVLINAGANIIRFLPPLIASKEDVDKMIGILDKVLQA